MKRLEDLTNSAKTMHDRYATGRMEREIVREWVLGLGGYPEPYATAISEAAAWFKVPRDHMDVAELKIADLDRLAAIYRA
jgi:hypothetical protein